MCRLPLKTSLLVASLLTARALFGTTYAWNDGTSGIWQNAANWNPNSNFPKSGDTAVFQNPLPGNVNVELISPAAVNALQFNYTSTNNVDFFGPSSSTLTFDNGGSIQLGAGFPVTADVIFSVPTLINTNLIFTGNATAGTSLLFEAAVGETTPGSTFTINGASSAVAFLGPANTYTGATIVNSGTVSLDANGVSIPGDLQILGSGQVVPGSDNQISSSSNVTVNAATGFLDLGLTTQPTTIHSLTFQAGLINNPSSAGLVFTTNSHALTMRNTTLPGPLFFTSATSNHHDITYDPTNIGTATISGSVDLGGIVRTFVIDHNAGNTVDMLVSGPIQNGGISLTGSGALPLGAVLQLTGANTYTGTTRVSLGTLQAGAANTFSPNSDYTLSDTLDLNSFNQTIGLLSSASPPATPGLVKLGSGTLTLGTAGNSTYSGGISDGGSGGSLVKQNSGTFTFSGTGNYTGTTSVTNGRLSINGTLTTGSVSVASGATLGGTGTITGPTTVNGTLSPGNSIGTLSVSPSVTLADNSTNTIEIDPTSASRTDVTGAPGTFTIGSNVTLAVTMDTGIYPATQTYTIVTTTGGVPLSSRFATVTGALPTFGLSVSYVGNNILLTETSLPFSNFFTSGNAGAVASCLDTLSPPSGSDLELVVAELRQLPTLGQLNDALSFMQPSQFTALALAEENATLYTSDAIFQRLKQDVRSCKESCKEKKTCSPGKHQAFWLSPFGGFAFQTGKNRQVGFKTQTGGIATGYDFSPFHHWLFGAALGYAYEHLKWKHGRGDADMHNGYGALYVSGTGRYAYLFGALMGSYNHYHAERNIFFGQGLVTPIDRSAKNSHQGGQGSAHLQGGLFFGKKVQFLPFAQADYIFVHEGSYTEHGAKSLNLHVKNKNSDLLQAEVGVEISRCFSASKNKISPSLTLAAIREWRFLGKHIKSNLEDSSCVMRTEGMNPDRTLFSGTLGLLVLLPNENCTLSFQNETKVGERFQDNRLTAQFLYKF